MGAGHSHTLYVHEHTRLHHLVPEVKIAGALGFAVVMAVTPRTALPVAAVELAIVASLARSARLRPRFVLSRLSVIVPFLLMAMLVPFVAGGAQVDVAGVSLSREGLWGAWNIASKATLGGLTSIVLAGTTEVPDLLRGLERLRVPAVLTTIAMFMVRYLEVVGGEVGRTRTAMTARGYDPRWLWQVRPLAAASGALFIRSYERGERVHQAMLSRGWDGRLPDLGHPTATTAQWRLASLPALTALLALLTWRLA